MRSVFTEKFRSKNRQEWSKIFDGTDACVAPVINLNELNEHPHTKYLKLTYEDQFGNQQTTPAPRLSSTPALRNSGVFLTPGLHSMDVMKEFGYSEEEIQIMKERKELSICETPKSKL